MFSPEFIRFLVSYQETEGNKYTDKKVVYFKFSLKQRALATVNLLCKK